MIWSRLERYRDHGLLVLRLGFGMGFFWYHGLPKLMGGPENWAQVGASMGNFGITFAPAFWGFLAGGSEALGGLLIAAGLFFRPAVTLIAFVMVSATVNHWMTGQGTPAHSFKNFWVLAGLFLIGPGRFSVDHRLAQRSGARTAEAPEPVEARR